MLNSLLKIFLQQRSLCLMLGVALIAGGFIAWQQMPMDAFPDVSNVQVMILSEARGLAPLEIERQITFPIEVEMKGLPRVQQVRSLSKAGLSQVVVIFDDDVDIYFARQVVQEKLLSTKEKLPAGVEPAMGPISTGLGEIYQYVIKSGHYCQAHPAEWAATAGNCRRCSLPLLHKEYSLMDLRTVQDWLIAPQLRKLRGVNEVNSFGGFVKQYHVIPHPHLLRKYDIALAEVSDALQANNSNVGGNYIISGGEQRYVVTQGFLQTIQDIEQIVLKSQDGTPVYLHNVADVKLGGETRQGAVTQDGQGEAVIGMVIMLRGSNSRQVVASVIHEIEAIQETLPAGLRIEPFYDRTTLIHSCIKTVSEALLLGGILLALSHFAMFWNVRAAIIVTLALPLTTGFTFICMKLAGMTSDMMSLGGLAIALGIVVDASIVVTTNISQHYERKKARPQERTEVAHQALVEVALPIATSMLLIVLVFLPLFSLESLEKKMFEPLGATFCFAMLGSLCIALTIVAAAACQFLKSEGAVNKVEHLLQRWYDPILHWVIAHRRWAFPLLLLLLLSTVAVLPFLGTEFLPPLDEGAIAVNIVRLPSASLDFSKTQSLLLEQSLRQKFPEITTIVSKSGRAEIAEDPMGPEQTDMFIMLRPHKQWKSKRSKAELVEAIRDEMVGMPGIKPAFSQPIALRVNELISGIKSDVALKIFGEDLDRLKEMAEAVAPVLGSVKGATDIKIEQLSGFSQIEIAMNRPQMARHKINADSINLMVETAVGGKIVTHFLEGERRFAVLLRFPEEYRGSLPALEGLLIPSPLGYQVPLSKVAHVREVEVPAQISRENGQRRILIECNILGRDMGSFIKEAKTKLADFHDKLPAGYRLVWGGQFENQQRAMYRLSLIIPIVILSMFLLLFITFQSVKSSLLVLLGVPFALVGGIWILFLFNINLSVSAMIGLIALLGIAVEASTVLVSFFRQLEAQGMSIKEAVITGTKLRLLPVVGTNFTAMVGMLPLLLSSGPGADLQRPIAAVIVGGLSMELLLVLFIFPALYLTFHREAEKR